MGINGIRVKVCLVNDTLLNLDDYTVLKTIEFNKPFKVGNSFNSYIAIKKYDGSVDFYVIKESEIKDGSYKYIDFKKRKPNCFILPTKNLRDPKIYLMATTSGGSRNGLFHVYNEYTDPWIHFIKTELELPMSAIIKTESPELWNGGKYNGGKNSNIYHYRMISNTSKMVCITSDTIHKISKYKFDSRVFKWAVQFRYNFKDKTYSVFRIYYSGYLTPELKQKLINQINNNIRVFKEDSDRILNAGLTTSEMFIRYYSEARERDSAI